MSRKTTARVRGPTGSISSPGPYGPGSESPRGQPAVPGDTWLRPKIRGVYQLSQGTRFHVRGAAVSTSTPGQTVLRSDGPRCRPGLRRDSGQCLRACGFGQLSRVTRDCARGPTVSNSFPGCLTLGSVGPRFLPMVKGDLGPGPRACGGPAVPSNLCPCPMSRGVYQLSRTTRARVPGTAGWTSCPGRLVPGSACPQVRPAVPRDLGPFPRP